MDQHHQAANARTQAAAVAVAAPSNTYIETHAILSLFRNFSSHAHGHHQTPTLDGGT